MEIKGKVHCFFEQSGTFKNEFIKLGIPAEDYDIQNNFGETDHVVDLFKHIEREYDKTRQDKTIFDTIGPDDLIIAFFPCIYFECCSMMLMQLSDKNYKNLDDFEKVQKIIQRSKDRQKFYELLLKMVGVCIKKELKLVFENPWAMQHYLKQGNFLKNPTIVDTNRMLRGDYFVKPTAYWFFNCEPTCGFTKQFDKKKKSINSLPPGRKIIDGQRMCSEERSMISPDYARNFICDFILGKKQEIGQLSLF
jgi:hypothetical protein